MARLPDLKALVEVIRQYVAHGRISDGLVYDAVQVRLIEIGEAIKALPTALVETEQDTPWADISGPHVPPGQCILVQWPIGMPGTRSTPILTPLCRAG